MEIISAREFRANQTAILSKVNRGESVLLTSRVGTFKITPLTKEDKLTGRIEEGLKEVKQIKEGKMSAKPARKFIDEL